MASISPDPTKDLIQAARSGDHKAWSQLDDRHRTQLAMLIRGRIPPRARARFDTEDLVQSALLSAYEELDSYEDKGEGSFRRWITTILLNRLRDRLRAEQAAKHGTAHESEVNAALTPESQGTPSEQLAGAERSTELVEAVADLPDDLRIPLMLHRFDGKTFEQVGEELGLTSSTVGRRIARAFRLLAERLKRDM